MKRIFLCILPTVSWSLLTMLTQFILIIQKRPIQRNRPYLNEGIVIKYNANQKYCTDAVSAAMFKDICHTASVPVQTFTNRSDMAGGSTLGNISNTQVALNTVDIGLPQFAMHSPYETTGVKDTEYLIRAATELFA